MSDRRLSASFAAGPPSPSSPAAGSLKENRQLPVSSDHIPQTPTSPPLMSVSDQSHVSNFTSSHTSPNQATTNLPNTSSPPSSTPMSTQVSQQPTVSTTNSFPTPASSVNAASTEDADQKSFSPGIQEPTRNTEGMSNQKSTEHRRTDHDRQPSATGAEAEVRDFATGQGQQATDGDAMDLDKEPVSGPDAQNLSLDSLQKDFTSAFHLCKSCKNSPSLPTAVNAAAV
jgi:hypothetical protein